MAAWTTGLQTKQLISTVMVTGQLMISVQHVFVVSDANSCKALHIVGGERAINVYQSLKNRIMLVIYCRNNTNSLFLL